MALVSSSVVIHMRQHPQQQLEMSSSTSRTASASSRSLRESREEEAEEKMYVALGKEYKEGKETLTWAINHTPRDQKIVLLHVHQPPRTIIILGGKFSMDRLSEEEVRAYREQARLKTDKSLEAYLKFCSLSKVRAEKLVIETDDIAKGIVELIAQHGITKLVMGAAADRQYSKRMRGPKSRTAIRVQQNADTACTIWFVCKGNLIYSRDASLDESRIALTPAASASTRSTHSEPARPTTYSSTRSLMKGGSWDSRSLDRSTSLANGNVHSSSIRSLPFSEVIMPYLQCRGIYEEDLQLISTPGLEPEEIGIDNEKLQQELKEAEDSKQREAYLESVRRQKAEIDAELQAETSENLYIKEVEQRKEAEATLQAKEKGDQIFEEVINANKQKQELELKISNFEQIVKELAEKLSGSISIVRSLREENNKLQRERDDAEELLRRKRELEATCSSNGRMSTNFSDFTYSELERATNNFDDSHKIGEGGYGSVYKGFLRHTNVAIKKLKPESGQGHEEFYREVDILSQVRHPHLVALIGKCSEAFAIVYEYLPQGSLDDRLACRDGTPPLSWQARTRIITEICSAVIFLHSGKPYCIVHGDIKPSNILLDSNLVSKLGDFGISRLLVQSDTNATPYHLTLQPRGSIAYMDPEVLNSMEITPRSDVYSFGIIVLRMLTGRPAVRLIRVVTEAIETDKLQEILDVSAGDWPFVQAERLAHLALRCCDIQRKNRPDLAEEVWRVLEPMMMTMSASPSPRVPTDVVQDVDARRKMHSSLSLHLPNLSEAAPPATSVSSEVSPPPAEIPTNEPRVDLGDDWINDNYQASFGAPPSPGGEEVPKEGEEETSSIHTYELPEEEVDPADQDAATNEDVDIETLDSPATTLPDVTPSTLPAEDEMELETEVQATSTASPTIISIGATVNTTVNVTVSSIPPISAPIDSSSFIATSSEATTETTSFPTFVERSFADIAATPSTNSSFANLVKCHTDIFYLTLDTMLKMVLDKGLGLSSLQTATKGTIDQIKIFNGFERAKALEQIVAGLEQPIHEYLQLSSGAVKDLVQAEYESITADHTQKREILDISITEQNKEMAAEQALLVETIPQQTRCQDECEKHQKRIIELEAELAQEKKTLAQKLSVRDMLDKQVITAQQNLGNLSIIHADTMASLTELAQLDDENARRELARNKVLNSRHERMIALRQHIYDLAAPPL